MDRDTLLADYYRVARNHNDGKSISVLTYAEHGRYDPDELIAMFGSWTKVKIASDCPPDRQLDKETMLDDLHTVVQFCRDPHIITSQYDRYGRFSDETLKNHFGTWDDVRDAAGLPNKPLDRMRTVSRKMLLDDIVRVADEQDEPNLNLSTYEEHGRYSTYHVQDMFERWNKAKETIGLLVTGRVRERSEQDQLKTMVSDIDQMASIVESWDRFRVGPKNDHIKQRIEKLRGKITGAMD